MPFTSQAEEASEEKPSLVKKQNAIKKPTAKRTRQKAKKSLAVKEIVEEVFKDGYTLSSLEAMTVCWRNEKNHLICDGPLPAYTDLIPVSLNSYFKGIYKGGKHCRPRKGPISIGDKDVYYCDFPLNPDNRLGYPVIEDTLKKYGLILPVPRKRYKCKDDVQFVGDCIETGTTF